MPLRIQHERFWQLSDDFILDSRFRFGDRPPVTKFVYSPTHDLIVLGTGHETPSHKALISAFVPKKSIDTSYWVRGILLRPLKIVYYRQGVRELDWYRQTTEMLKTNGLPDEYRIRWGPEAKEGLGSELEFFP